MLLLLFACNPWSPVHERELTWYDPDRVETELGVDLVDLPAGEPLPPAARVVIRTDRIEFDNRGWFLDLPDAFFLGEDLDTEQRRAFLQESTVVELDDGVVPGSREGLLIEPLYDTLDQQLQTEAELARKLGTTLTGDFHLVSEPDVPWETVMAAMYTGGQARFGLPTLVGRVGDRLGSAMTFSADVDTPGCGLQGTQVITAEGSWIHLPDLPALTGPDGCSGMDWTGLHESIGTLLDHCEPLWQREVEGEPPESEPEPEPEPPSGDQSEASGVDALFNEVSTGSILSQILAEAALEEHDWNCMEIDFLVKPGVTFEQAATAMGAAYERYP
ncbi:MAG: hypothetical protein QGG40_22205, partial [Myxococcota bacterium]|nr:hypothetical protein [Myxococcota bacterium]